MDSSTQGSVPFQAQEAEARPSLGHRRNRPREAKDRTKVTQHFQGEAPEETIAPSNARK